MKGVVAGVHSHKYFIYDGQKKIRLVHKETIIGRGDHLMVRVDDTSVDKKHATIDLGVNHGDPMIMYVRRFNNLFIAVTMAHWMGHL